jgi:hypothetical protein
MDAASNAVFRSKEREGEMSMRRSVVVMMTVLMVGTAMASLGVGGTAQGQEVPDPAFIE